MIKIIRVGKLWGQLREWAQTDRDPLVDACHGLQTRPPVYEAASVARCRSPRRHLGTPTVFSNLSIDDMSEVGIPDAWVLRRVFLQMRLQPLGQAAEVQSVRRGELLFIPDSDIPAPISSMEGRQGRRRPIATLAAIQ